MNVGSTGGIDVGQFFKGATDGIDQGQLLEMQFAMGQYNAKLEAISSMTKSIQDMLKSLAQRTG